MLVYSFCKNFSHSCCAICSRGILLALFSITTLGQQPEHVEKPEHKKEAEPYYSLSRDELSSEKIYGGITPFFSATLNINKKLGDITFTIEGTSEKQVEFNLNHNLSIDGLGVDDFLVGVLDNKGIGKDIPFEQIKKVSMTHYSKTKASPERGIVYLCDGELFSKKVKIWNLFIWDKLVEYFEKSPDADIKLRFRFITKVDDVFFRAYAECPLNAKDMRSLVTVKKVYDKNPDRDNVPKTYDKRYRTTELIEKGDGEVEVKGEFLSW